MVDLSSARAYDAMASEYDEQLARNPVAVEMRARLHRHMERVFRPGDRVLDFTSGTGTDALYLASYGVSVTALDASSRMLAELRRSAARRELPIETRVLAAERLGELDADFDGAISTFAGLNSVENMPRLARDLAACVRPGGRVILHALNAFCLWQSAASLLVHRAKRRREMRIGAAGVRLALYNPHALHREAFASYFELRELYALSVIAAPAIVKRAPRAAHAIFRLDRAMGRLFPEMGDFFVIDLERRDARTRSNR